MMTSCACVFLSRGRRRVQSDDHASIAVSILSHRSCVATVKRCPRFLRSQIRVYDLRCSFAGPISNTYVARMRCCVQSDSVTWTNAIRQCNVVSPVADGSPGTTFPDFHAASEIAPASCGHSAGGDGWRERGCAVARTGAGQYLRLGTSQFDCLFLLS